jgi:hypothetical protein
MNELLTRVLEAHGGLKRWNSYEKLSARIVTGGAFRAMKGLTQDHDLRLVDVWIHRQQTRLYNFGNAEWHLNFKMAPSQLNEMTEQL